MSEVMPPQDPELAHRAVRGHRRGCDWVAVTHGAHRQRELGDSVLADLAAWQLLMPNHGCFTGLTVGLVRGWWMPPLPAGLPVFMALQKNDPRPMRKGVRCSRHVAALPFGLLDGIRCADVPETLLACARLLGLVDLVVLIDCALKRGETTLEELRAVARPRRPGRQALLRALGYADGRAESPWETLLRLLHVLCGIDVEPQWELYDAHGTFVARADLRVCKTTSLHEYDGAHHQTPAQQREDLRRAREIGRAGHVRRGYTAADVISTPAGILRDAQRALGMDLDPSAIRPWLEALQDSLFTPAGTVAFLARLSRDRGV